MRINDMITNEKMLWLFLNQILATKFWKKCMEVSLENINLYGDIHYWGLKSVKKILVGEVLRISPRGPWSSATCEGIGRFTTMTNPSEI